MATFTISSEFGDILVLILLLNLLLVDLTPSERESFSFVALPHLYCLGPPFIPQVRSFCTLLISLIYSADEAE